MLGSYVILTFCSYYQMVGIDINHPILHTADTDFMQDLIMQFDFVIIEKKYIMHT